MAQLAKANNEERGVALEFDGTASEYFRIWIVGMFLIVCTAGLYSPWAKVRSRRYFLGHTTLDGRAFHYLGQPAAILKGRLLVILVLGSCWLAARLEPGLQIVFLFAAFMAAPWIVVRALSLRAAYTEYCGVRCGFRGTYAECSRILWGWGLATVATFGLAYPQFKAKLMEFIGRSHFYGDLAFEVEDLRKPMLDAYTPVIGWVILAWILMTAGLAVVIRMIGAEHFSFEAPLALLLFTAGAIVFLQGVLRARSHNALWNAVRLGPMRFSATLRGREMGLIYFTNAFAITATLGLATPWARVRTARYRIAHMAVHSRETLSANAASKPIPSATADEVADLVSIDVAF